MPAPRKPEQSDKFGQLITRLAEALLGNKRHAVAKAIKGADATSVTNALRAFDPRLTAARDFNLADQTGVPPAARERMRTRAGIKAAEGVVSALPFTPAILADALTSGRAGSSPEAMMALALGSGAGRVGKGVRVANALAGNMKGLPTQLGIASAVPLAVGASEAAAETPLPERKPGAEQGAETAQPVDAQYQALVSDQQSAQATVDALRKSVEKEAASGFGPLSEKASAALAEAEKRLEASTAVLRSYRSPEQLAEQKGERFGMMGKGLAVGGGAALLSGLAAYGLRRGALNKLGKLATRAEGINSATATGRIANTNQGDELASLVNEAYRTGESKMPFVRGKGRMVPRKGFTGRPAVKDDALFGRGSGRMVGDTALPTAVGAEGLASLAYGSGAIPGVPPPGPEQAQFWQNMGLGSLVAATGFKGARTLGKMALPKGEPGARAIVNAARTRLEREMTPVSARASRSERDQIANSRRLQQERLDATQPLVPRTENILPPEPDPPPPFLRGIGRQQSRSLPSPAMRRANGAEDVDLEESLKELARAIEPNRR